MKIFLQYLYLFYLSLRNYFQEKKCYINKSNWIAWRLEVKNHQERKSITWKKWHSKLEENA